MFGQVVDTWDSKEIEGTILLDGFRTLLKVFKKMYTWQLLVIARQNNVSIGINKSSKKLSRWHQALTSVNLRTYNFWRIQCLPDETFIGKLYHVDTFMIMIDVKFGETSVIYAVL